MSFEKIDPTTPAGTDKIKFGDDRIREFKGQMINNFKEISNYNDTNTKAALRTATWTTATRPTGSDLVDRVTGYNTDLGCEEYYDLASTSWKTINGTPQWSVATRPTSAHVGFTGYNSDLDVIERWDGSAWKRISGKQRGFVDMWSGSVASIPTGWVLADGVQRTHPEGGTYTPPDLRNRFIVGAGQDGGTHTPGANGVGSGYYAPGATGGEDKHTLTTNEMPSHAHLYGQSQLVAGGTNGTIVNGSSSTEYTTSYTGGGASHENRPPYYALCFLYKI